MTQERKSHCPVGKKSLHESICTANFDTWSSGLGLAENRKKAREIVRKKPESREESG
jgi:hypothetical protein